MSSARLPEHGDSLAAPGPAPAPDSTPAALFLAPTQGLQTAHLVPCAGCGELNGRSALTCWSCEADLLALAPFAQTAVAVAAAPAVPPIVELVVEPEPAALAAGAADGRRGLHLVARTSVPLSGNDSPTVAVPEHGLDLPVLTVLVEDTALPPARKRWYHDRPMIALALAALALLAAAAGLRWLAPPPAPVPASVPVPVPVPISGLPANPAGPRADAIVEQPFAGPASGEQPDRAPLSFPPTEVGPDATADVPPARAAARNRALPSARTLSAAPRPVPQPREIRETVSPPPAACTSNMAALGFCTLPPATAKE